MYDHYFNSICYLFMITQLSNDHDDENYYCCDNGEDDDINKNNNENGDVDQVYA